MTIAPDEVKIVHMPLPIKRPEIDASFTKQSFGLPNRYTFLFTFDFFSVMKRKNPLGLIQAFCAAFSENEGPVLVLKSINGMKRLSELEKLKWAIKDRSDIILIDEYFDVAKAASLMAVSDCYVSLHRSEGLGLTMAEAMTLAKPVIATGYSGNIDFMTDQNSILIPWKPIKVGKGAEGYAEDAEWADPDLVSAANAMRKLYLDPESGVELGRFAQSDLAQRFSLEETGKRMKNHLTNVVWR
jgi:glycosyltransferase involved in cell wall biosynthesis